MLAWKIGMTKKVVHRLKAVAAVVDGRLRQPAAASKPRGLTARQAKRLAASYRCGSTADPRPLSAATATEKG